jgi:hypothetical protein
MVLFHLNRRGLGALAPIRSITVHARIFDGTGKLSEKRNWKSRVERYFVQKVGSSADIVIVRLKNQAPTEMLFPTMSVEQSR